MRLARTLVFTALLTPVAAAAIAAPAEAGCGGPVRSYPRNWKRHYRPPLVIGDSTMIFAVPYIAGQRMQADARGCRQWSEGMGIIRQRKHAGTLPHLVVMGLGANWVITSGDIESAVKVLGPKRVLGLIVPRESGGGTSSDAYNVRKAGRRHRNRVKVLDWPVYSSGKGWFSGDGLHMTHSGAAAYARFIAKLRPFAPWPKPKKKKPKPPPPPPPEPVEEPAPEPPPPANS